MQSFKASYDWAMPAHDLGLPNNDDICLTQSEVVVLPRYFFILYDIRKFFYATYFAFTEID